MNEYVLFINNLITSYNNLVNLFPAGSSMAKQVLNGAAFQLAVQAATVYAADQAQRLIYDSVVKIQSFDALGNYTNPDPLPDIMTVNDLENTLAAVRTFIQEAVDQSRQLESLKAEALVLLNHVDTIKLQREKIVQIQVNNPTPLHLILLDNNIPYNEADHIMSINSIDNPNFTRGAVNIYAG